MKRSFRFMGHCICLCSILIGCELNNAVKTEPEPEYKSFREEVEVIVKSTFRFGGVAVGIIRKNEEFSIFHGAKNRDENEPPDENTIYEIGSITKTFTATLLADFVSDGTAELEDEVQSHLPADSVTMPMYTGIPITLWHLATHTSGFIKNLSSDYPLPEGSSSDDPFEMMTREHVYDYLTHYAKLSRAPGIQYEYSNFGYGLLGLLLSRMNGSSYEKLLKTRILDVLQMDRTSIHASAEQLGNIAVGHGKWTDEVGLMPCDHALVGCGHIKSSLKDMIAYLKANMGILDSHLKDAMELAHQPQFGNSIGLGWHMRNLADGKTILWHGGATPGYISFIGFERNLSIGVVILYNWAENLLPENVGMSIFEISEKY